MDPAPSTLREIAENRGGHVPPALQTTLTWSADGEPGAVAVVDANRGRKRRRDGIRGDIRRTTEYLSTRGKLPIEALHDLVGMGWVRAVRLLVKELGVTRERAYEIFERAAVHLLPYTAPRLNTLELGDNAAGGLALGHFLAAKAMGEALQSQRYPDTMSRDMHTLDGSKPLISPAHNAVHGEDTALELPGLPPRASD